MLFFFFGYLYIRWLWFLYSVYFFCFGIYFDILEFSDIWGFEFFICKRMLSSELFVVYDLLLISSSEKLVFFNCSLLLLNFLLNFADFLFFFEDNDEELFLFNIWFFVVFFLFVMISFFSFGGVCISLFCEFLVFLSSSLVSY